MKNLIFFLLIGLLSCKSINKAKQTTDRSIIVSNYNEELFRQNGKEQAINEIAYQELIRRKKTKTCAQLLAYAKTSLQFLSLRNGETDFSINNYQGCRAYKQGDSILINFNYSPIAGAKLVYFAGKPIEVILNNSKFEMSITHTSDVRTSTKNKEGKYVLTPFPQSEIKYARLELDQANYAVGDTIKGYLKARSVLVGRKNKKTKEIIKGAFRVIVEDKTDKCK